MVFSITGNATGLQAACQTATASLNQFASNAGGIAGQMQNQFSGIAQGLSRLTQGGLANKAVVLAAGIGSIAASVGLLTKSSIEYVNELNKVSSSSGLKVSRIQQYQSAFKGVITDAQELADLNKDAMDHLSDGINNGASVASDLKSAGVNIARYMDLMKSKEGGLKSIVDAFYQMKKAGNDNGTIVHVMESIASNSSKMIPTLEQYKSYDEAMLAIDQQRATITDDDAKKYKDLNTAMTTLGTDLKSLAADALTPVIGLLNDFISGIDHLILKASQIHKMNDDYQNKHRSMLNTMPAIGDGNDMFFVAAQQQYNKITHMSKDAQDKMLKNAKTFSTDLQKALTPKTKEQPNDHPGKTPYEIQKEAAAAKAAATKLAAARKQAQSAFDSIVGQFGTNSADTQYNKLMYQEDTLQKKLTASMQTLGMNAKEQAQYLKQFQQSKQQALNDLGKSLLNTSDSKQLNENIKTVVAHNLASSQDIRDAVMKNFTFNNDNPFANSDYLKQQQDQLQKTYQDQQSQLDTLYQNRLVTQDEYQQKSLELQQDYADKSADISNGNKKAQLSDMEGIAGSMSTIMGGIFGDQSAAYQSMFGIKKGFAVASATLDMEQAIANAMSLPFPENIPAIAKATAAGAEIVSAIRGTNYSGQFHGGVDEIPQSMDNKSFILKAGERVVQPESNKKLTQFLDDYASGNQSSQQQQAIVINAPLVINGNTGSMTDKDFNNLVRKNSRSIYLAVSDAQKRGSTTK